MERVKTALMKLSHYVSRLAHCLISTSKTLLTELSLLNKRLVLGASQRVHELPSQFRRHGDRQKLLKHELPLFGASFLNGGADQSPRTHFRINAVE